MQKTVSVIGLGYMGLPLASLLANSGHTVVGVDINPLVVARVNEGLCPFTEAGMEELVKAAWEGGNLRAVEAPEPAEIFVLSLPTPVDHGTNLPDMTYVRAGATSIAAVLQPGNMVVLESTSPVGATEKDVKAIIEEKRPDLKDAIDYVFCPERAIPGATLREMVENDRLVGGLTPEATARGIAFYQTFVKGEVHPTTANVAEMVKLVENASRDVQIAFANELSMVCHKLGINVWDVIALANKHPRVNILKPSTGVGGHCIAVDPWFIINQAPDTTPLLKAARGVNDAKPLFVLSRVREACEQVAKRQGGGKVRVACLGLAYKPNVDDLRESPSAIVVKELARYKDDVELLVSEPYLETHPDFTLTGYRDAVKQAQVVVVLTAHDKFREIPAIDLVGKELVDPTGLFN